MTYDSLLLNCGGGIISTKKQSAQYTGAAALAIGIGGTGVAALAELKRKVYQQLIPDNPDQPVPRYQHIQMLAIDSDESDIVKQKGKARLDKSSEFLSIQNPNLRAALAEKNSILQDPCMNWMDIEHINNLLDPNGAGGVRQVGRYLLISKAATLYNMIKAKCTEALSGLDTAKLDVYIFAGISGGTGSGCFLDTCYIVRQVLKDAGWDSRSQVMGFFFLPDVVTSKTDVAAKPAAVKWNNSNGYAAMKELDYLMSLKCGHDRFYQNYGSFKIDTQDPPVDMCHLLSAVKSDGSVLNNGFGYCINVAADYVMSYLAQVELGSVEAGSAADKGLTMRGHLSNVANGVSQLQRKYGANLSYHVLGASNAEIPMTQIATYLASYFYERFETGFGRQMAGAKLTKNDVDNWMRKMGLTAQQVSDSLRKGCQMLFLPDVDKKDLATFGTMPKGQLPQPWATPSNDWLNVCSGKREANRKALNGKLNSYIYTKVSKDSLLGKVFVQLHELCIDPAYGPYYAAALLSHEGYDLISALDGEIHTAAKRRDTAILQLEGNSQGGGLDEQIVQASADFCSARILNKKPYDLYKSIVEQRTMYMDTAGLQDDTVTTLQKFKEDLQELRKGFFDPLIQMLDTLGQTFRENRNYLNSNEAKANVGYTWRILELSDVKKHLDKVIEDLTEKQLLADFMEYVLAEPEEWLTGDDGRVSQFISHHMESVFSIDMNRSLQDYLFEKYPQAGGNVNTLAQEVEDDIVVKIHNSAMPMFWCDPSFQLVEETFQNSSISVPSNAIAVCNAATHFMASHPEYAVRKTGLQDRIFALRFCSGVPLFAYKGIVLLKHDYDEAETADSGVGAHLYSETGRGTDGTGNVNWRTFLPVPMAYSKNAQLVPNSEEKLRLYDEGVACGVIYSDAGGVFHIRKTGDLQLRSSVLGDFIKNGEFQKNALESRKKEVASLKERMENELTEDILLKNDGASILGADVVERVRKDYFLHYPRLQEVVRKETAKAVAIERELANLSAIEQEQESYERDLRTFSYLLFYDIIQCLDVKDKKSYTHISQIRYEYTDSRNAKQSQVFTNRAMPYGEEYPEYQAFLNYRKLDPSARPRRDMDKTAIERASNPARDEDNWIALNFYKLYNGEALHDLEMKTAESMEETERSELLRFYYGFRKAIDKYKDIFNEDDWNREPGAASKSAPAAAASVASYVWDPQTGRQIPLTTVAPYYVLDPQTNSWVLLNQSMQVFDTRVQAWVPLKLDGQGMIVL